jgi:threonine/homoserine/homoserine lactone efflux protein
VLQPILDGFFYGLALSVMAGPIFFTLMQLGIERGFRAGLSCAAGQWLSDLVYITIAFFGLHYLSKLSLFNWYWSVIGGGLLILFGVVNLVSKPSPRPDTSEKQQNTSGSYQKLFAQGFLINTFNPFPIFFWFTVGNKYHHTHTEFLSITASIVFMVSFTDVLKILLARRIRSFLQAHHIVNLKRLSGALLILFGVIMIVKTLYPTATAAQ